jgi:hypothetical protein
MSVLAGPEFTFEDSATDINEREAISFELLNDETFVVEKAGDDAFLKVEADAIAFACAKEGILLVDQRATQIRKVEGNCGSWIRRGKRNPGLVLSLMG